MLNATGLGIISSTLSTVIETVTDVKITVVITGPIAPPTILIIFVTAEEIPVYSLGENEIIVLINVVGNSAPAIPNIKSAPLIDCDVEWKSKSNKNETAVITMPGTNNFIFSPLLLSTRKLAQRSSLIDQKPTVEVPLCLVLVLILMEKEQLPTVVCL